MDSYTIFQFDDENLTKSTFKVDYTYINLDLTKNQLNQLRCYFDNCKYGLNYVDELTDFLKIDLDIDINFSVGNLIGIKLKGTAITVEPEILIFIYTNKFDILYSYTISNNIGDSVTSIPLILSIEVDHQHDLILELYDLPFVNDD